MVSFESYLLEQIARPLRLSLAVHTKMDHERLADQITNCHRRIQGSNGILEHDLHRSAVFTRCLTAKLGDFEVSELDRTRCRFDEAHDGTTNGRLSGPGLAHEAERLARHDLKTYALNRSYIGLALPGHCTLATRKRDGQVFDL